MDRYLRKKSNSWPLFRRLHKIEWVRKALIAGAVSTEYSKSKSVDQLLEVSLSPKAVIALLCESPCPMRKSVTLHFDVL